jgi:hypothetical protein
MRAANNLSKATDLQLHGKVKDGQEKGCQEKGNQIRRLRLLNLQPLDALLSERNDILRLRA